MFALSVCVALAPISAEMAAPRASAFTG